MGIAKQGQINKMKDLIYKKRCRICGGSDFIRILDLGKMSPANHFLEKKDLNKPERKYPLIVFWCRKCFLLQLRHIVRPDILFANYPYLTASSKPLADHFIALGREIARKFIKSKKDLVVEIGSNDGVLIEAIKKNCRVLGIDPAKNIAKLSSAKGFRTICGFFSSKMARKILAEEGPAKIIIANNVIAHIDDIHDVFRGINVLLADDGCFIFEVHWVGNLIGDGGFDQIYHEHLSYFSLLSLQKLIEHAGMIIADVKIVPIHGQSLRVYVRKNGETFPAVKKFLEEERNLGLDKISTYKKFSQRVQKNKTDILQILRKIRKERKTVIGYGAPAKGNTLLSYCGVTPSLLSAIVDTTPLKQGKYTPGTHIPIYFPDKLKEIKPDFMFILAWNYADDIVKREYDFRKKGGKFILPVPQVKKI